MVVLFIGWVGFSGLTSTPYQTFQTMMYVNRTIPSPYHTVPYRTAPYRTVPYRTAPHHTVPYRTAPHHTVPYRTAPYHTVPYRTAPHHTVPYRTAPHHTVPYRTAPYHTVPYRTAPYHTVPLASDHAFALPPIELAPPIHTSRPSLARNSSGSVRIATAMFVNGAWGGRR